MAVLSVQQVPVSGLAGISFAAADVAGDDVAAGVSSAVLVKNDDTVAHTVTLTTPGTVSGLAIEDPSISIAAGAIGAFPLAGRVFGSPVMVDYGGAVTGVTVAAIQLAR